MEERDLGSGDGAYTVHLHDLFKYCTCDISSFIRHLEAYISENETDFR